jgi:HEAT repeat protein
MAGDIATLMASLSDPILNSRASAAEELSSLGEKARAAAVPLVRAAGDDCEDVREWAVAALEALGPPAESDLQALAELLDEGHSDIAYWAATLVGRLGKRASMAISHLLGALGNDRPRAVRERAAWALGKIGPKAGDRALAALDKAAADAHPRLARLAQRAIELIGN